MGSEAVAKAIEGIRAGRPVLLPADGVYGLCATPEQEEAVRGLYELKGRDEGRATAIVAASVATLFELVPELRGRSAAIVEALLPGPYTLILPNPAHRYPWLNGTNADAIGVRVARLPVETQLVLDAVGSVVATSANDPGAPAAAALAEVPARIRAGVAAEIDAGRLTARPSTVIDFTGAEPVVVREGSGSSITALARVADALG